MAKIFKQIMLLFVVLAVIVMAVQAIPTPEDCKDANEEFVNCGTSCPDTCGKPKAKICTYDCVIGCQCKKDFWRHSNGACVEEKDC